MFSKKKANLINLITSISIISISVATVAMVIVLSAFNGLDSVIKSLYKSFDPDIKITSKYGKTIGLDSLDVHTLLKVEGVERITKCIEETCYLSYNDKDAIVKLKGVESNFDQTVNLKQTIIEGAYHLRKDSVNYGVFGYGIAARLSLYITDFPRAVKVYAAKRKSKISMTNPEGAFHTTVIYPSGIFAINQDFDMKYVLVPFDLMNDILDYENEVSSIEIKLDEGANPETVAEQIIELTADKLIVKTRDQLNELVFKTNKTEKWIAFCILLFVIIIAAFNLMGAVTMMILEKKKEIFTLKAIGLSNQGVRNVFTVTGMLISVIGVLIGIVIGTTLCLLQQYVGLIPLNGVIVDYYPVKLKLTDMAIVLITVVAVGYVGAVLPERFLLKNKVDNKI